MLESVEHREVNTVKYSVAEPINFRSRRLTHAESSIRLRLGQQSQNLESLGTLKWVERRKVH